MCSVRAPPCPAIPTAVTRPLRLRTRKPKLSQRLLRSSGKQLGSPAQCSRFTSDEFLQDPKLRDFTSQCESDCVTPPKPPGDAGAEEPEGGKEEL